jgi:hypothetical protein
MHYKNGREAKNGDKVVLIPEYPKDAEGRSLGTPVIGILYDAQAGNDYCNGRIARINATDPTPNLKECVHLEDFLRALPKDVPDTSTD